MKIALIAPPFPIEESPSAPLGLCYVAAAFEKSGAEVKIFDYVVQKYSEEKLKNDLSEFSPDVVGITSVTLSHNSALSVIKAAKKMFPKTLTIMGGPHISFDFNNTLLNCPEIDLAVIGEGESTISELVSAIFDRSLWPSIKGVAFRNGDEIVVTEPREFVRDLDSLPLPARHLIDASRYRALGFPVSIITSRGCPHRCIFCQGHHMVGHRVRSRDVARIVDEIEALLSEGFSAITISDDFFTSNADRVRAICDEIHKRNLVFRWTAFARADSVNQELLTIMKNAGCTMVFFGIESGNQAILDRIKKRVKLDRIRKAVADCKAVGMEVFGSFIIGLPGETKDTLMDSHRFAVELKIQYGYHFLAPFPGTELMENMDQYDLKLLTRDWSLFDANQAIVRTESLEPEDIERFYEDYYMKIIRMIEQDIEKRLAENQLSESEHQHYIDNKKHQVVIALLSRDLIESIEDILINETEPKEQLAEILSKSIDMPVEYIKYTVNHLTASGCILYTTNNNRLKWRWA